MNSFRSLKIFLSLEVIVLLFFKFTIGGQIDIIPGIYLNNEAEPNQFPWQVSLRCYSEVEGNFEGDDNSTETEFVVTHCSGIIIGQFWILTTAHCIGKAKNITIGLGSNKWYSPEVELDAYDFMIHPKYHEMGKRNDIGLINLFAPLVFSESIQSILLPRLDQTDLSFVGVKASISGWGIKEKTTIGQLQREETKNEPGENLQWASVFVISNKDCILDHGSNIIDSHLCARGAQICYSDLGGPLAIKESTGWMLIGVTSFSQGCTSSKAIVFSRMTSFLPWILNVTNVDARTKIFKNKKGPISINEK